MLVDDRVIDVGLPVEVSESVCVKDDSLDDSDDDGAIRIVASEVGEEKDEQAEFTSWEGVREVSGDILLENESVEKKINKKGLIYSRSRLEKCIRPSGAP